LKNTIENANGIRELFAQLSTNDWGNYRIERTWIGRLYHVTDITNAASIIHYGSIFSRKDALARGLMVNDNASAQVLGHTPPWVSDYARFYFRPRVPAFYHNEGFITRSDPSYDMYGAHCPIPVAFEFHAELILLIEGTKIADGNLASYLSGSIRTGDDLEFLANLPFERIYSDGPFPRGDREYILRRHAEVIVPNEVKLDTSLRRILCRSQAEAETLRSLSADTTRLEIDHKIVVDTRAKTFHRRRPFVHSVRATTPGFTIRFHVNDTRSPLPFSLDIVAHDRERNIRLGSRTLEIDLAEAQIHSVDIRDNMDIETFGLELLLDGRIAFVSSYVYMNGRGILF
jgi:hypothetical protein